MPKIQQHHSTAVRRVDTYDNPMVVPSVRVRHHGAIPNSGAIAEVLDSRHRLLHKMGRN